MEMSPIAISFIIHTPRFVYCAIKLVKLLCFARLYALSSKQQASTVIPKSHKTPDSYINVTIDFGNGAGMIPLGKVDNKLTLNNIAERADAYKPKPRTTYKMIKEYIVEKYGFNVHTAYIAEVKRGLGLPMYDAPNAVETLRNPRKHPTPVHVDAIKDALTHFEII
jgi:hypothetical protein